MPYIKAVFSNIVMWRLDKCHWADSFVVGNRNIGTSFRACFDIADNFLDDMLFLTFARIEHCTNMSVPFILQDVSSACLSKSRSVKLAPFRIPLVANPVIRQPIWLRSSEVFCFSFLDYIIPHGEEEVNGFFVVFLPIFFLHCGYFLVTISHNFPQSLK